MSNRFDMENEDDLDPRPCAGKNANVCVADLAFKRDANQ